MIPVRMNLSLKSFCLVLIPLLFSIGTGIGAIMVIRETHKEEERQITAEQISSDLSTTQACVFDAGRAIAGFTFEHNPKYLKLYERSEALLPEKLGHLRQVLTEQAPPGPDKDLALKGIANLEERFEKVKSVCDKGVAMLNDGDHVGAMEEFSTLKMIFKKFNTELLDIRTVAEKIVGPEDPELRIRNREKLMSVLVIGLISNLVIAVVVTFSFNRDIVRRMNSLMVNTHKLAKKEELNKPIPGNDEIAQLDEVLYDSARALASAEKMKQEFMQMVSHDLRTPLTSIQLFLNLVGDGAYGALNEKGQQKASMADANARRLIKMVSDLLDIEKMESGKLDMSFAACSLNDIVERSVSSVRTLAEQSEIGIKTTIVDTQLKVDADRLIQVMINLIGNAIKFAPAGSTVEISTTADTTAGVAVRVKDCGRGVPESMREAIFQRFQQVETADAVTKGGTGLGLAISKMILEQHGGAIGVESGGEQGSLFWFTLPPSTMISKEQSTPEELSTLSAKTAQQSSIES